jgi:hypothetical protein
MEYYDENIDLHEVSKFSEANILVHNIFDFVPERKIRSKEI